jgi:hypothetical protein
LFDEKKSKTHEFYDVIIDLHYGVGSVYGYNSIDHFCISENRCAPSYSFLSVAYQTNLSGGDNSGQVGFIGLGMHNTDHTLDLFITKMKKEGVITKAMFSIYVDDKKKKEKTTPASSCDGLNNLSCLEDDSFPT